MGGGVSRRRFLTGAGALGLAGALEGVARAARRRRGLALPVSFTHGVASGDPLADRVILWTRAVGTRPAGVTVTWEVATDRAMRGVVRRGTARARPEADWTVKVDATGLAPGRTYHYRFAAGSERSPVGRTRTAPAGAVDSVRLAVATCGDYSRGLFNAYARLADRDDLDAVVHLGDYIYETAARADRVRRHVPAGEIRTLAEYRERYASYRADPALARMHARHPVIWVWDDHETSNGAWRDGAASHDPAEDGSYAERKAAALRAALDWLPIRSPDARRPERIHRRFAFGDLVDLVMLDTRRIGRDRPGEGNVQGEFFRQTGEFADPRRHILGAEQEAWLLDALRTSRAAWKLLGNQVVFSQIKVAGAPEASGESVYANPDQWDGYAPARGRVLDVIEQVEDVVILTGDVHASIAFEVTRDPNDPARYDPATSRGAAAVELVAPSISSAGDPQRPEDADGAVERLMAEGSDVLRGPNPHLKYIEAKRNGYLLLDVDPSRLRAEFWLVPTVTARTDAEALDRAFTVARGRPALG